jgi:hypothetical protein
LLSPAAAKELMGVEMAVKPYKQIVQQQESSLAGQQNKIMAWRC